MKYIIVIDIDNNAFYPNPLPETIDVLKRLIVKLREEYEVNTADKFVYTSVMDVNGNTVCEMELEEDW